MAPRELTLSRLLRERGHHLTDPNLFARARAEAHAAETSMPDDDYPPDAIRVLDGFGPLRRRPAGHAEDVPDPAWLALSPEEREAVLLAQVIEMVRNAGDAPPEPGDELPDD